MSRTVIRKTLRRAEVLTNAFSVKLSEPGGTYGVRRSDTDAVVVSDGQAMTQVATGIYEYGFTDPASNLEYEYYLEIVWTDGDTPTWIEGTIAGGGATSGNLYDLKPFIKPLLPGIPEPLLEQQLRWWARDFCQCTELWEEQVAITAVVDQTEYDFTTAEDAELLCIRWARLMDTADITTPADTSLGAKINYKFHANTNELVLDNAPTIADQSIVMAVSLLPRISNTELPQQLLDRYGPVIVAGTLANCCAMPKKPWSDPEAYLRYWREYRSGAGDASVRRVKEQECGPIQINIPTFV